MRPAAAARRPRVAIPFQIYDLTGSNFAVGAIGVVELVPVVVFGLYGGALADPVDRRRLLVATGVGQALLTVVLAVNALHVMSADQCCRTSTTS